MEINPTVKMEISNKEIGQALADIPDDDFAEVMFAFAQSVFDYKVKEHSVDKIKALAKALSPRAGAYRKNVWKDIMEWVTYFEKADESNNQ